MPATRPGDLLVRVANKRQSVQNFISSLCRICRIARGFCTHQQLAQACGKGTVKGGDLVDLAIEPALAFPGSSYAIAREAGKERDSIRQQKLRGGFSTRGQKQDSPDP